MSPTLTTFLNEEKIAVLSISLEDGTLRAANNISPIYPYLVEIYRIQD